MGFPSKAGGQVADLSVTKVAAPNPPAPTALDPALAAEMLFNTMVLYGPTGTRKTSQIGSFARYIYEKTGKVTRLISADGGGWAPVQDLINAGIIEAWRVTDEPEFLSAIRAAAAGAWPKLHKNGIRIPGPIAMPLDKHKALKDVGAYAVEGFFSIASAVMGDTVDKGRKINEDVVSKFNEKSDFGEFSFGAPSRGHYGFAQRFILDMIKGFTGLPVDRTLFTSLEGKGEDKLSKQTVYGPATAGGAITAAVPQYVGDCIHFEDYFVETGVDPTNDKQKLKELRVRAWFQQHPDTATNVMWPAKCRLVPSKIEEFKKIMGLHGYFDLNTLSIYDYLKAQDDMLSSSSDEAREWKAAVDAARAQQQGQ